MKDVLGNQRHLTPEFGLRHFRSQKTLNKKSWRILSHFRKKDKFPVFQKHAPGNKQLKEPISCYHWRKLWFHYDGAQHFRINLFKTSFQYIIRNYCPGCDLTISDGWNNCFSLQSRIPVFMDVSEQNEIRKNHMFSLLSCVMHFSCI